MAENTDKEGFYGGMMNDFFNFEVEEGDEAGRMMKQSFQGNAAQSVLDMKLAKNLGQFNAGIAKGNMTHQADLEQRNRSATMADEFMYGMNTMDAQFKYGEKGAANQHERDLGMLSATGEQQRLNIGASGHQDRLTRITDGEQTRMTAKVNNASKERIQSGVNDANKYVQDSASNAQRDVATTQKDATIGQANIQKDSAVQTTGMKTQADIDIAGIEKDSALGVQSLVSGSADKASDNAKEANMYGSDKTVDVANINAQGTIDNTTETGNQTRQTMGLENQLKAKDRASMHKMARGTARAM